MSGIVSDEIGQALDHIERNGSLAWMDRSTPEVMRLYGDLERKGYVRRNTWSGRLEPTPEARQAVERTKEIGRLMRL